MSKKAKDVKEKKLSKEAEAKTEEVKETKEQKQAEAGDLTEKKPEQKEKTIMSQLEEAEKAADALAAHMRAFREADAKDPKAIKRANKKIKTSKLKLTQKRAIYGFLFILPWLVGFIAFYAKSIYQTVLFSFSKVSMADVGGFSTRFIGITNYKYVLTEHASFNQILVNSLIDMVIDVPLIIFFSLFMALLLNQKFRGRTIVRAIFFLPVILNSGAIADAIELARASVTGGLSSTSAAMAESASSSINLDYYMNLFSDLGLPKGILDYVVGAVGRISDIIQASGVQIVIFIASLQSVPPSLYEVSKIEGATAYETFWKVTFPMVTPLILTNVVYTVVDSFVNSDVVDTAYETAFTLKEYGNSSAMSMLSTVSVCIILIVVGYLINRKTFYYN